MSKLKFYLLLICFFFVNHFSLSSKFSQNSFFNCTIPIGNQSNLVIAEQLANCFAHNLKALPDTIFLRTIASDPQLILINSISNIKFIRILYNYEIDSIPKTPKTLILHPAIFYVEYSPIDENKIQRNISLSVNYQTMYNNRLSVPETFKFAHADTITYEQALIYNSASPSFLQAPLPQKPRSLWQQAIQPALIFATLAATVWLFFSVRSK